MARETDLKPCKSVRWFSVAILAEKAIKAAKKFTE
jgi:hypothetical protein